MQILYKISAYLSKIYQDGLQLSGIVYLHRITDTRLNGFIGNNLAIFKSLCGDAFYPRVVLATTGWDSLPSKDTGNRREADILRGEWGLMCQRGSKVFQLEKSGQSALGIVEYLIDLQTKDRVSVQEDLADEQEVQLLGQISQELSDNLGDTMGRYEKEFSNMRIDMDEANRSKDVERIRVLGLHQDRLRKRLEHSQRSRYALFANLEKLRLEVEGRHDRLLREISPVAESVSTPSTGSQSRAQRIIDREKVEKLLSELERRGPPFPEHKKQTSVILHRRGTGTREQFAPKIIRSDSTNTQQTTTDSIRLGKRQDVAPQDRKDQGVIVQRPSSSSALQSQPFQHYPYEQSVSSEAISTSSGLQSQTPKSSRDYLHLLSPGNREYWSRILNPDTKTEPTEAVKESQSQSHDYHARVSDSEDDYQAANYRDPERRAERHDDPAPIADATPREEPKPHANRALSPESQSDASILSYMNPDRRAYWSRVLGPDADHASTQDSISELALSPITDLSMEQRHYPFPQASPEPPPHRHLSKSSSPIRRLTYQEEIRSLGSSRASFDRSTPTPSINPHGYREGFRDVGYRFQQQDPDSLDRRLLLDEEDHGLDWSKLSLTDVDRGQNPPRNDGTTAGSGWESEIGSPRGRTFGRQSPLRGRDNNEDYNLGISRWDQPLGYS